MYFQRNICVAECLTGNVGSKNRVQWIVLCFSQEGIEDGSELPSDMTSSVGNLQLMMPTDVAASVSFDVSASRGPVGNLSPVAIHDHVARQVNPHEEHFSCEVPSFVEEFNSEI